METIAWCLEPSQKPQLLRQGMKMEIFFRGHSFSILQVIVLVVWYRGNVSGETAEGCVGFRLRLACPEMKVIQVSSIVIADADCRGGADYIDEDDCTKNASGNRITDVRRRCEEKQSCAVDVLKERIDCGSLGKINNDFERITYSCKDDQRDATPKSTDVHLVQPTVVDNFYRQSSIIPDDSRDKEQRTVATTNDPVTVEIIVVLCVVCLVVIIAIVVSVSIFAVGRQKRQQAKMSVAMKKSDLETDGKAAIYINEDQRADIYINEDQGTSLNQNAGSTFPVYINDSSTEVAKSSKSDEKNFETLASDYCELKGSVAAERIQSDGEYDQLDHGKNYEPTIVYEQL